MSPRLNRLVPAPLTRALLAALLGATAAAPLGAQAAAPANGDGVAAVIDGLSWRNIGPANMAGRIADVEGIASPSATFYVVTAAGGVWKTTNNGTTFFPVLDTARVASGGDLAIAPSDTNVVYVGMGEPNSRNSISPGGGVYKSTDGGASWTFVGLGDVRAFGRLQVHPDNPDVVWAAGLGHPWRANAERGLYKTTDGGETWRAVLQIDDRTGVVDVQLDPRDPDVLWAASYRRVRGPYFYDGGGPGSGLWKSTDGGETWTEVTGGGLPEQDKGRIGIAISPSSPDVMYLMLEADTIPTGEREEDGPSRKSGLYRSDDGGKTWEWRNPTNTRPFYYSQVRVHPTDPDVVYWSSTPVKYSRDGGKTAGNATQGVHVDHHAMWFDPANPDRFIIGNDGGVAITYDGGGNFDFLNHFAIGQFYNISLGQEVPYTVCGGLQDNGSWCGPSRRRSGGITNAMWHKIGGGDGFGTAQDPVDHHLVYATSQGGNVARYDLRSGARASFDRPSWRDGYQAWEDSIAAAGDDRRRVRAFRERQRADSAALDLRYNWNTPYFLSPHNPKVVYVGANRVLKSRHVGEDLQPISPDLTYADTMKIRVSSRTTGGVTPDVTGAEQYATIVALAESPRMAGMLYAGTDDGRLWITRNDGGAWTELTAAATAAGVPAGTYVSRVEPSPHADGTVYVTFDNHRRGDNEPYVLRSTDFGASFTNITTDLPRGEIDFVHVVREDPHVAGLLFVGTDVGVYVSVDDGGSWHRFMTDLPTVPVRDLRIHAREHELVAGTHGRSIWIADILPLEQHAEALAADGPHLYAPRVARQWADPPVNGGNPAQRHFETGSTTYGADLWYRLPEDAGGRVRVVVQDAVGDTLASLAGNRRAGVHRVTWNFRGKRPPAPPLSPAARRDSAQQAERITAVLDSLEEAEAFPSGMINTARRAIARGPEGVLGLMRGMQGGGGGGGRVEGRPAETRPRPSFPEGRRAASGGGRDLPSLFRALRDAVGDYNPFRGRGGGAAPFAGPGTFRVTLVTPAGEQSQELTVADHQPADAATFGFAEAEDAEWARAFDRWVAGREE